MADYQGISLSMKSTSTANTEADVVAFDQCSTFSLPAATVLLKSHRSGMRVLVPADMFGLLQNCVQYQTITSHLDSLVSLDPGIAEHKGQLQQMLEDLKKQGVLDSGQQLISGLKTAGTTTRQPAEFAGTFIRTCDRPAQLKRLLDSLSKQQQRFRSSASLYRSLMIPEINQNQQQNQTDL